MGLFFWLGMELPVVFGQVRMGSLPSINYNHKLKEFWELNFKIETRVFLFQQDTRVPSPWQTAYDLTDLTLLGARKIGLNNKVVLGGMVRTSTEGWTYRTIQQFIFNTTIQNLRMVSRVATDQTFSTQELPEFRWRYRASTEIPLSGQKVDATEFYLKINLEKLSSLQAGVYDLEFRAVPHIGYVVTPQHKIELGLDTRLDSFLEGTPRLTTWFSINWYIRQLGAGKKK